MKKRTYTPRKINKVINQDIDNTKPQTPSTSDNTSREVVEQKPPVEEISISIPVTPLSPTDFCNYKKIMGLNKSFLEKKYNTKSYTIEKWLEILTKENIDN
jgi:hypothetical protein